MFLKTILSHFHAPYIFWRLGLTLVFAPALEMEEPDLVVQGRLTLHSPPLPPLPVSSQ